MAKTTKEEKFKKVFNMTKYHGEIIIYFTNKYHEVRRRKLRSNGDCFVAYKSHGSGDWTKFGMSCFLLDDDGPKSLSRTIKLLRKHDGSWLSPYAIEIDGRMIEL